MLRANIERVRARIADAARRAGRNPARVRLVAVTKSVGPGIIRRLIPLGISDLGENRIQDATRKMNELPAGATWHLIGHLQANKSRRAVESFAWIHSIDSARLLERVDQQAAESGASPRVLLQVNVSGEATKHGFTEHGVRECLARFRPRAVQQVGLMTMAPLVLDGDVGRVRSVFARLRELLEDLRQSGTVGDAFDQLSMGMTDDFEQAVEQGATMVRVGRALYRGLDDAAHAVEGAEDG